MLERRSVVTGVGMAIAGAAAGVSTASAQSRGTGFQPMRHDQDAWLDSLPGGHRVFIDSATAPGGAEALLYANNLYMAQENAYSGGPEDFGLIVCFRHFSTPFGYADPIWAKYGEVFNSIMQFPDPDTGSAPRINLMNSTAHASLPNFGITIDNVGGRGTQFAVCAAATRFIAGVVAEETDQDAEVVNDELRANAIANSRFVSAGVIALTRSQEYGYSLLYSG